MKVFGFSLFPFCYCKTTFFLSYFKPSFLRGLLFIFHMNHKAEWRQTCYDFPRGLPLHPPSSSSSRAVSRSPVASLGSSSSSSSSSCSSCSSSALHENNSISPAAQGQRKKSKATCANNSKHGTHMRTHTRARTQSRPKAPLVVINDRNKTPCEESASTYYINLFNKQLGYALKTYWPWTHHTLKHT